MSPIDAVTGACDCVPASTSSSGGGDEENYDSDGV